MAREDPHFRLRIPEALRARIASEAEANKRSMTAEIIGRLEASFEAPALQSADLDRRLMMLSEIVEGLVNNPVISKYIDEVGASEAVRLGRKA